MLRFFHDIVLVSGEKIWSLKKMNGLRRRRSHSHAQARQHNTTNATATTANEIADGSKAKYGATTLVTSVKMGENTTMASELRPKKHRVLRTIALH